MVEVREEVTRLLRERQAGSTGRDGERLFLLVYDQLRDLAGRLMRQERRDHTLQATAVVHEAYLRLVDQQRVEWQGRTHFLAVASMAMRRLLAEYARTRGRQKRGGGAQRVTLHDGLLTTAPQDLDIEALEEALTELARSDPRKARGVEMRFFAGLSSAEIAAELGVTERTIERDWVFSRAWLLAALRRADGPAGEAARR